MDWPREAKHLHGHSGILTIELEDTVDPVTGFAHACKDGIAKAWEIVDSFHHATLFQEGDPLLEPTLKVYDENKILNDPEFCVPLKKFENELGWNLPEYRIVITKKVSTCENLCELFYSLLKDELPIKKITMRSSPINCASKEF